MFEEPTIEDKLWMLENIPVYKPSEKDLIEINQFKELQKVASWKSRQELKDLDGFNEPFPGYFAGIDLWPEGAPAKYYKSLENK